MSFDKVKTSKKMQDAQIIIPTIHKEVAGRIVGGINWYNLILLKEI